MFSEKIDVIVAKSKTSNEQDERNYCGTESILREVFYLLNLIACFTCMYFSGPMKEEHEIALIIKVAPPW